MMDRRGGQEHMLGAQTRIHTAFYVWLASEGYVNINSYFEKGSKYGKR